MKTKSWIASLFYSSLCFSSSYAINLHQITITDPIMGSRTITYEQVGEFAVVEGDILIGKAENLKTKVLLLHQK